MVKFTLIEDTSQVCEDSLTCPEYGFLRGGYFGYSSWSFVTITLFNAVLSLILIIIGLPLLLVIGLAIKLRDGGPILYKGLRLGLSKNPFHMYKFRTLPVGAQRSIGPELFSYTKYKLPPFSKFLRDTRLDELPQLFNILMGDMDFVGPRPMRPEVYEREAANVPNMDMRFIVRPGLIGYAQLYTPHSTPKRLRAKIDNKFVLRKRSRLWDVVVILYTMSVVFKDVAAKGSRLIWRSLIKQRLLRIYRDLRSLERVRTRKAAVMFRPADRQEAGSEGEARLVDINESFFKMHAKADLTEGDYYFVLEKHLRRGGKERIKKARCQGRVFKRYPLNGSDQTAYVIEYKPLSPLNGYMLDQYFLRKSII